MAVRIAELIAVVILFGPERSVDAVAVPSEVPDYSLWLGFLCFTEGEVRLGPALKGEPDEAGSFDRLAVLRPVLDVFSRLTRCRHFPLIHQGGSWLAVQGRLLLDREVHECLLLLLDELLESLFHRLDLLGRGLC